MMKPTKKNKFNRIIKPYKSKKTINLKFTNSKTTRHLTTIHFIHTKTYHLTAPVSLVPAPHVPHVLFLIPVGFLNVLQFLPEDK